MAYGFLFNTGPQGGTTTTVVSSDVAPGFIVPSVATTTATVTSITSQSENGQFVCGVVVFNADGGFQAPQPGLQNGYLEPDAGITISGPGLPANCQITGHAWMPPQSGTPFRYSSTFLIDKAPTGTISTAKDAYTITVPSRDFQYVAHGNDYITRLSSDLYNYQNVRPMPDTVLDFSSSPFSRHDLIVLGSPYMNGQDTGNGGTGLWNVRARAMPAYWIDQTNKKAYVNFHKNWQGLAEPITISTSTGSTSTTVTLATNLSVPIQQEMRVFGPGCGPLGIRVTRSLASAYSQFTVDTIPAGGWSYTTGAYTMTSGASTYDRLGMFGGDTDYGYSHVFGAGMWWKVAVIGRMI